MKYLFTTATLVLALLSISKAEAKNLGNVGTIETITNNNDSLRIVELGKVFQTLTPLDVDTFKGKIKKELNGFALTEVDAFLDDETGAYCTVNYRKGDANIYLMISDGAKGGSENVIGALNNFIGLKEVLTPEDKCIVKEYKGFLGCFDYSMFESDGMTSIQYLENNRYLVVASANQVSLEDLKSFIDSFSLK